MARPKVIPKEPDLHCNSIITHDCRKKGAACRSLQISKPTLCKTILSSSFVLESRTETDKLVLLLWGLTSKIQGKTVSTLLVDHDFCQFA